MSRNKILVAFFALLIFSGCSDELILLNRQSKLIQFGTTMRMDLQTKTYYDDDQDGGTICWQENNDQIMIYAIDDNGNFVDPSVYTVIPNPYSPTRGSLSGGNLSWRPGDTFRFYGLYPETLTLNNNELSLTVSAEQANSVDMKQVYMVARTDQGYGENPVSLDFYPLVTTITLIVENDRENAITTISDINLTSAVLSLAGTYTVNVGNGQGPKLIRDDIAWPANITSEDKTISIEDIEDITIDEKSYHAFNILLIPQEYEGSDIELSFNVNDSVNEKSYRESLEDVGTIEPGHRYFIWVAIKENGEITPPKRLSPGGSQLFGAALMNEGLGGNNAVWAILKDYYAKHPELGLYDEWGNNFNNNLWNTKVNKLLDNLENVTYDDWVGVFGEEAMEILLQAMQEKITNVRLTNKDITESITAEDLQLLFPNATEIHIQMNASKYSGPKDEFSITVSGLNQLTTLDVLNANVNKIEITGCESLENITLKAVDSRIQEITLKQLPNFYKGEIQGNNPDMIALTIYQCSQNKSGATLSFLYGTYKGHVIEYKTESDNLTVEGI